jgi:hypothetical protein
MIGMKLQFKWSKSPFKIMREVLKTQNQGEELNSGYDFKKSIYEVINKKVD